MRELPEGWIEASVAQVADDISYGYTASANQEPNGPKYLRITDIQNGVVDWETVPYCSIPENKISNYELKSGDLLFARTGATTGKSFLIRACPVAVFASYLIRVRHSSNILPEFIASFFQSKSYWDQISENVSGSAQPNCNATKLSSLVIPLPPLAEQRRIVEKLEPLLDSIGAYQHRLAKIPVILKRFRQAVLAAACDGRLTAKWREDHGCVEWETKPLGELITDPKNGYSSNPVGYNTAYRVLTLTATTSGRFKPEHFKYFDEHIPTDSPLWLRPGDILVQRGNTIEYVGVSAIYDGAPNQYIYPDLMIKFRAKDAINAKFLHIMLSWERTRNYFRENATGTAGNMPKINQKVLAATPIDVPSKPEQQEIVRHVETLFKLADQIEARYQKAKPLVDKLQQSILAKAFRGELLPTEAELARREGCDYEPASVLLERIKSERAEHAQGRKEKAGSRRKPPTKRDVDKLWRSSA